jgi:ABC-2 type transport system ATP-binding protein
VIKSILNLIKSYDGVIKINNISSRLPRSRAFLGYCPEREELPSSTILDFLLEQAAYCGVKKSNALIQIHEMCKYFDFPKEKLKLNLRLLSSGLKKIIMLMQSFLGNRNLIILDEPTANLDFETRMLFYKFILSKSKTGTTFFISTHDLFEIKEFANYYIRIANGKILSSNSNPPPIEID